ncbi:HAD-IA family hydrolase [Succinatimonas hippei]|uniref:HAD-IA family hydrolase n=1 Tax=Succinatimonas hippei TaxID=626938 RepID=UPI0025D6FAF1|nr:HAD-IA family hydrolase [Succinatimonas hippei]
MKFFKKFDVTKVKALSFDLDDTLYDNHPVIKRAEEIFAVYLQNRYHLPPSFGTDSFWSAMKLAEGLRHPEFKEDVTKLRVHTLYEGFKALNRPLPQGMKEAEELVAYFVSIRSKAKVPDSSFKLLSQLREHYPVAALSNGNSDLKVSGLFNSFDYNLRPSFSGFKAKPHADLFNAYASMLKIKPENILHVGDEPYSDVHGAVYAGCQCAWLYRGFAGDSPGFSEIRVLPQVVLSNLCELKELLNI